MSLSFRHFCVLTILVLLAALVPIGRPALAAGPYVVTKTADTDGSCASGVNCSLREAIKAANAAPGTITFNIPTSDSGYQAAGAYWRITINLTVSGAIVPLPALTGGGITIDGLVGGKPKIELSGAGSAPQQGILIRSANNTVKGLIINGFVPNPLQGNGIRLAGAAATGNTITQNYLGTNYNATAAGGTSSVNNVGGGIAIENAASGNIIDNNIIAGNGGYGVFVFESVFLTPAARQNGNSIRNNYIGVAADGITALGNLKDGVYIGDNSINTQVGPNNIISANGPTGSDVVFGVNIGGYLGNDTTYISGNRVFGNKIGTNAAGTAALGNAGGGVLINSSTGTTIGGANGSPATPNGEGNLISGNKSSGVRVKDTPGNGAGTVNISLQNNWIGLNLAGTAALPNANAGVYLSNSANAVSVGPNNVISGNANDGVLIEATVKTQPVPPNQQVRSNTITTNFIGTNASGDATVPNGRYGVQIQGGTFSNVVKANRIAYNRTGGIYLAPSVAAQPTMPTDNTISANLVKSNGAVGIALTPGSNNNIIGASDAGGGNTIEGHTSSGVEIQSSGNQLRSNELRLNQVGIVINSAANNTIGGATAFDGNVLHDNTLHGILVNGNGATGNRISHTITYANGGKGIALTSGGNAPIAGATLSATPPSGLTLSGTVSGCAAPGCTIEVFTADSALDNEGPAFLTSAQPNGAGAFSIDISGCQHYLIFTLTDAAGNTSEFISPLGSLAQCVPTAPAVGISTTDPQPPRSVLPGASTTYVHTVTNTGTAAGPVAVSLNQSANGWATLTNNTCTGQSLAPQATCSFSVKVDVPGGALAGEQNVATAQVTIGAATGSQVDTTIVLVNANLAFVPHPTLTSNAKSTGPGQPVSYQHKLTNLGNGPDSFTIAVTPPNGWAYSIDQPSVGNLAPNAFTIVTVVLTPTAGLVGGTVYTTTVTAGSVANPAVSQSVADATTITAAAVPQIIASAVVPPSVAPGASVQVAYTVKNAGNLSGTFTLAFTGPSGWGITQALPASVGLGINASTTLTTTLQVPANALAGAYQARLVAADQANPAVMASRTATISVKQQAALTIGPDIADPTPRAPGQVLTYTLTLQNGGNFTDTVGLALSTSRGWSVRAIPPAPTLAPGTSLPIKVELSIPPGQLALPPNLTTITATSSLVGLPQVRDTAQITTSLAEIAAVDLSPARQTQPLLDGKPVTFTLTLRNIGSIAQSYSLAASNVPSGWQSTLTPTQTQTLQPNQTAVVTLVLLAPAGQPNGQEFEIGLSAACRENSCDGDTAVAVVRVGPPIQLGGACNVEALPGATVICLHTIKNASALTDTFTIAYSSYLGWPTTLTPQVLVLGPGATRTFTVTTTVPPAAPAHVAEQLKIVATSSSFPNTSQEVTDVITVRQYARLSFVASQGRLLVPGQTLTFRHQLRNIGNAKDGTTITVTQQFDWKITLTPTSTLDMEPGLTYPVTLKVEVPANVAVTAINQITVRATSIFSPTVYDEVIDIVGVQRAPSVLLYLPVARQ